MESVLYEIEELQKLAGDLAGPGGVSGRDGYIAECELFLERIENFVLNNNLENVDYLWAKLADVRGNLKNLFRVGSEELDLTRYQALVENGLNAIYMNIKSPVMTPAAEEAEW